jgi:single-strand DNA-binding protein
MASFNRIILAGNLTRDFEVRYTQDQAAIVSNTLAVNRKFKDKDETTFVDFTAFGKQAETMNQYLKKGSNILIEGRLQQQSWTTQEGQKRSKLVVIVESFQFLDSKGKEAPKEGDREYYGNNNNDDVPF